MRTCTVLCFCAGLVWANAAGAAETPDPEPLAMGPSGTAYLDALKLRRIDTEVRYYDPTRPAPELETDAKPPRAAREGGGGELAPRLTIGLPALLILIAVIALFLRYGGGLTVSFGRVGENARGPGRGVAGGEGESAVPAGLGAILAIDDRRAALVTLAEAALARAVAAQGLLFQKSWTGRDVLRHLPRTAPHWDDLRGLVLASERVHFGGRDVSEDEFRAHVHRIRPLIEAGGP